MRAAASFSSSVSMRLSVCAISSCDASTFCWSSVASNSHVSARSLASPTSASAASRSVFFSSSSCSIWACLSRRELCWSDRLVNLPFRSESSLSMFDLSFSTSTSPSTPTPSPSARAVLATVASASASDASSWARVATSFSFSSCSSSTLAFSSLALCLKSSRGTASASASAAWVASSFLVRLAYLAWNCARSVVSALLPRMTLSDVEARLAVVCASRSFSDTICALRRITSLPLSESRPMGFVLVAIGWLFACC